MKHALFILMASLLLTGCPAVNPYHVPAGEGAHLQNRRANQGSSYFEFLFKNAVTTEGQESFEPEATDAAYEALYTIPSGDLTVGLTIRYFPEEGPVKSVGEALGVSFKFLFSSEARERFDSSTTFYELRVINPESRLSGLEGLKLHADKGKTYQINCKIEDGKAYIWLEDKNGERVTDIVRGLGITKHGEYFYWEDLPATAP